jgi:putative FmdB family regulatory protein
MPNYDYRCPICGIIVEKYHSITHDPVYYCTMCGCVLKKMLGKDQRLEFKGDGFYCNDYKQDSTK